MAVDNRLTIENLDERRGAIKALEAMAEAFEDNRDAAPYTTDDIVFVLRMAAVNLIL